MSRLTEKTWIPLGLAVVAIGGGSMWLTSIYFKTEALAKDIQTLSKKQDALEGIQTDIAVIKSKLDNIERKLGEP